jgi:hypothetical protein
MAKSFETTWNITEPGMHSISLHVDGGVFSDTFRVDLDSTEVLLTKVSGGESGSHLLLVDGRPLELRWKWSAWSGKPEGIALVDGGRTLASYGGAAKLAGAAHIERSGGGAAAKAVSSLVSLVTIFALLGFMFFVPIRTCPHCAGIGSFIVKCQACDGNGKQTAWQILRSDVLPR